jgi:hypothetical protein
MGHRRRMLEKRSLVRLAYKIRKLRLVWSPAVLPMCTPGLQGRSFLAVLFAVTVTASHLNLRAREGTYP